MCRSATQEVRALSRDIGLLLEAAEEVQERLNLQMADGGWQMANGRTTVRQLERDADSGRSRVRAPARGDAS